jgi:hypothetical protein
LQTGTRRAPASSPQYWRPAARAWRCCAPTAPCCSPHRSRTRARLQR